MHYPLWQPLPPTDCLAWTCSKHSGTLFLFYFCIYLQFHQESFTLSRFFFFLDFIYLLLERGEGREKARERNMGQLSVTWALTREWTCKPGVCPDRESNLRPFGLQDDAQPTEPHWSGPPFPVKRALSLVNNNEKGKTNKKSCGFSPCHLSISPHSPQQTYTFLISFLVQMQHKSPFIAIISIVLKSDLILTFWFQFWDMYDRLCVCLLMMPGFWFCT